MNFDSARYGGEVAAILQLADGGKHLMPLVASGCISDDAKVRIRAGGVSLFTGARSPEGALAGLYLYFGCWTEAHEIAQDLESTEGSYWHAMVHRQEPDGWNSGYWYRRVGWHAIFPALRQAASEIGVDFGPRWKPEAFIEFCEKARGPELEQALEVQRAEWQLLFDYCAR